MREIGGKTVRFGFISPSGNFFAGFFRSMSETLSEWGLACPEMPGFCGWVVRCLTGGWAAAGATSVFSPFLAFDATSAGFSGAMVLRPAPKAFEAGLRVAVLLLVFVAIVVPLKSRSWLKRPQTEPC